MVNQLTFFFTKDIICNCILYKKLLYEHKHLGITVLQFLYKNLKMLAKLVYSTKYMDCLLCNLKTEAT